MYEGAEHIHLRRTLHFTSDHSTYGFDQLPSQLTIPRTYIFNAQTDVYVYIVSAVRAQMKDTTTPITASDLLAFFTHLVYPCLTQTVVIVGGFSTHSEWLFASLQTALQIKQVTVCRLDGFV